MAAKATAIHAIPVPHQISAMPRPEGGAAKHYNGVVELDLAERNSTHIKASVGSFMNLLVGARAVLPFRVMLCFLSSVQGQDPTVLALRQTIVLPVVRGGFNHMSVDAEHLRLFLPAPTNKTL